MYPLQFAPSDPLGLGIGLVLLVAAIVVGMYVYKDARSRDMNETLWGAGSTVALVVGLLPGIVVLAAYFFLRS